MKKVVLLTFIALLLSCGQQEKQDAFYRTLSETFGYYTLEEAYWNTSVDIIGDGSAQGNDILRQLKTNGWGGLQNQTDGFGTKSILECNLVMPPLDVNGLAQVNLYLPYFQHTLEVANDGTETILPPTPIGGRCCADVNAYQFHYTIGSNGVIDIHSPDSPLFGDTFPYTNVKVWFSDSGLLYFKGNTTLWDFSSASWRTGTLSAVFSRHVDKQTTEVTYER